MFVLQIYRVILQWENRFKGPVLVGELVEVLNEANLHEVAWKLDQWLNNRLPFFFIFVISTSKTFYEIAKNDKQTILYPSSVLIIMSTFACMAHVGTFLLCFRFAN